MKGDVKKGQYAAVTNGFGVFPGTGQMGWRDAFGGVVEVGTSTFDVFPFWDGDGLALLSSEHICHSCVEQTSLVR